MGRHAVLLLGATALVVLLLLLLWNRDGGPARDLAREPAGSVGRSPEPNSGTPPAPRAEPEPRAVRDASVSGFRGRVTDMLDVPVRDASVSVVRESDRLGRLGDAAPGPSARVTTDARGRFQATVPAGASYMILVGHPEFAAGRPLRHLWAPPDRLEDVGTIRLVSGYVIKGIVVDPSGSPAGNVTVELSEDLELDLGPFRTVHPERRTTDARGAFSFLGLAPGAYSLTLQPPGTALACRRARSIPARPASAAPSEFRLEAGHDVRGRVLDALGRPVAHARVRLSPIGTTRGCWVDLTADAQGGWSATAVAGGRWEARARAARPPAPTATVEVMIPVGGPLTLELPPAHDVFVRIDANGRALPDEVVARVAMPGAGAGTPTFLAPETPCPVRDSGFRLAGLPAGSFRVHVRARAFAPATVPVEVGPGASPATVRLTPAATLTGRIRDTSGRPLTGLDLLVTAGGPDRPGARRLAHDFVLGRARTDPEGRYRVEDLPPGLALLRAGAPPYRTLGSTRVRPGITDTLDVAWPPPGGDLVVELTRPGDHRELQVFRIGGDWTTRRRFPASRVLHFQGLSPGRYGLRLLPGAEPHKIVEVLVGKSVPATVP